MNSFCAAAASPSSDRDEKGHCLSPLTLAPRSLHDALREDVDLCRRPILGFTRPFPLFVIAVRG
jgi:hypothetical protein